MPTIQQQNEIVITPEKFLQACSASELWEIDILIKSPRFRSKMILAIAAVKPVPTHYQCIDCKKPFRRAHPNENSCHSCRSKLIEKSTVPPQIYYCSICEHTPVDGDNGIINCQQCLDKMISA
ncbi:hypothetical protein [Mucilaginibacter sp.]|uniref:hypothetical protein n=1 Tax=Mucilaginibacter sp. TaxID=1882438 RepID=UPI002625444A|nr:hypothetical protein [Mucilaginibacter sp.]MDB4919476.1 hypothetical protein [Mucilaginibacter sp.]